jgi:uncharacterized protein
MKTIRDPVHGDIGLSEAELALVDTPAMQRLRRVKQLSFCSLVYPGANHTRFEHSLGTMHLAGRMAHRLGIEEAPIRMAALAHDMGHLPYSHSLESVFGISHEENLKEVLRGEAGDAVSDAGFDKKRIYGLVCGRGNGKLISSQIDADRMDYLLRDSHYTGVAYGVIDSDRIINVLGYEGGKLYFQKKGLIALEALLLGRNQMYEAVYFHHAVKIADAMLQEAMLQIKDYISIGQLLTMGDEELKIFAREKSPIAKELLGLLDQRRLYKVALSMKQEPDRAELVKKSGLEPHKLLVSGIRLKKLSFDILIDDSGLKSIADVSGTARNLEEEIKRLEGFQVCVPEDFKGNLG